MDWFRFTNGTVRSRKTCKKTYNDFTNSFVSIKSNLL